MGEIFCYKTFQHVLAITKFTKFNVVSNHQGQQQEQPYYMDMSNNLVVT
jgi:hypothetical protein